MKGPVSARWGWFVGWMGLLAACAPKGLVRPPGDPEVGVTVTWWGHSCFSFQDSTGRLILIDPFDDTVGYPTPRLKPDAVWITHEHFDHDGWTQAPAWPSSGTETSTATTAATPPARPLVPRPSGYVVVRSTGITSAAGVEVTGLLADHDNEGGRRHGTTRMYVWDMAGIRFAHLGDIGQTALREDQKAALTGVDVLMIPVGGRTTVDGPQAAAVVKEIRPRIVIPMHYGTPRTRFFEFDPLDRFLAQYQQPRLLPSGGFVLRRGGLPDPTEVDVPYPPLGEKDKEIR